MDQINEVTRDCFNALVQFRSLDAASMASPELPYKHLRELIDRMQVSARQEGYEKRDIDDMVYAVVALADELALHKAGAIRDFWMQRPLQLHYFSENLAGEGFFDRLNALMTEPDRVDVLRVYYTCLLFGFQGRCAVRGGEHELDSHILKAKDALRGVLEDQPLSVQPVQRDRNARRGAGFPAIYVALFFLLFSLGLLIVLRMNLDQQTADLAERMQPLEQPEEDAR